MNLIDYLGGESGFTVDRRASSVGKHLPNAVTIEIRSSYRDAITAVGSAPIYPAVIIREDGQAFIMSAGGSGLIWVCGTPTSKQLEVADKVYRTLRSMGAPFGFSQIDGFPAD